MADSVYIRLHISPLNPTLLTAILPPSILPQARNISYHNIETFPEKGYGYLELPVMDAEKIKNRLNGSILKGTKVRIEKARPQKEVLIQEDEPEQPKKERKQKRKRDELPGVDIGERHVKRGWTTPGKDVKKDKETKMVVKSKYTTGPECLFKTVLPPNVAVNAEASKRDKKVKGGGKEAVVHEFKKTTKYATFLRGPAGSKKTKSVAEFVEGKGWVDEDGNVVEEEATRSERLKKSRREPEVVPEPVKESESSSSSEEEDIAVGLDRMVVGVSTKATKHITTEHSSSEDTSSESEDEDLDAGAELDKEANLQLQGEEKEAEESSSEDSSSDSDSDSVVEKETTAKVLASASESDSSSSSDSSSDSSDSEPEAPIAKSAASSRPQSSSGLALTIKIPPTAVDTTPVHPLEALYKRPKPDSISKAAEPSAPGFSFFGSDNQDEDVEPQVQTQLQIPLTPFTQREFEFRGMRSAAPTPDTAHPNKQRFIWPVEGDIDEDDEETPSSPIRKKDAEPEKGIGGKEESEFQKWFWENRGDVTRKWKKRRKVAAKEVRQRENRKRNERV